MKKQTQNEFIAKSKKIFGKNTYDYSKLHYKNSRTVVCLTCKKHGDFYVKPGVHISYKRGCAYCSSKYSKNDFIEKAKKVHKNKYDYSKVKWKNIKEKILIICKKHGEFMQTPDKHINAKQGCQLCSKRPIYNQNMIIEKANNIHNNKYDYSKAKFITMFKNITIICKIHGKFKQTPANHIRHKQGCPKCYYESKFLTREEFIKRSIENHNILYDYSKVNYKGIDKCVVIICKIHGEFSQLASTHMRGANCQKCGGSVSFIESKWLDYLKIHKKYRNKVIYAKNKHYRVDAFVPETNTIYEFYGDFWHGNPRVYNKLEYNNKNKSRFKDLYKKTIKREKELLKLGYKLCTIWECDFKKILNELNRSRK